MTTEKTLFKLCIDVGNSFVKLYFFKENEVSEKKVFETTAVENLIDYLKNEKEKISKVVMSSVAEIILTEKLENFLKEHFDYFRFSTAINLPFQSEYQPLNNLGLDRLAVLFAAYHKFPNENVLIVDAGTCITYDLLSAERMHKGGAISPGLNMRLKALNHFTGRLPLVSNNSTLPNLAGINTQEAILSGVKWGISKEIQGVIKEYEKNYPHLKVVLTGGDIIFFEIPLKSSIFALENFLAIGLNASLAYQKNSESKNI